MPIYEYACPGCGQDFEKLLFRTDERVECPACGSAEVRRRLSSFSVGRSAPKMGTTCDFPSGGGCGSCPAGGCGLN